MNERFKELAEHAGLGHERWNTTKQFEQFMEKFAEVIVRECAEICLEANDHKNILRHFGLDK